MTADILRPYTDLVYTRVALTLRAMSRFSLPIDHDPQYLPAFHDLWTTAWHRPDTEAASDSDDDFMAIVSAQHRRNFDLWHEEDKARAPDATDAEIAQVKRRIDRLNQERNDLIEQMDETLTSLLPAPDSGVPWNTETPGAAIDRLSILALKIYHMREQTERTDADSAHRVQCAHKLAVLERQRDDLGTALMRLLADLKAGRKQLKLYRQFKMYNDPTLNPAIYGVE